MSTVKQSLQLLKDFAPEEFSYKLEYDNVGLIVGKYDAEVHKIICCLDVTEYVIDEAIALNAELIISHHPMIFFPISSVTNETVLGKKIMKAIENGISIYAAHTNLDYVKDGINEYIASMLGLRNIECMQPYISSNEGIGRVGELPNKVFCTVLKGEIESILKDSYVRIVGEPYNQVKRIAVINGAGGGDTKYVDMALSAGADCLVTADVKHHVAMYARESGITLIEPQHYTMEHAYISRLVQILKIEAKSSKVDVEILQSQTENNPRF